MEIFDPKHGATMNGGKARHVRQNGGPAPGAAF